MCDDFNSAEQQNEPAYSVNDVWKQKDKIRTDLAVKNERCVPRNATESC